MGITFDSTPEPTTLAGCAAASLALIWISRRRKKTLCPISAGASTYKAPAFALNSEVAL